jgi:hypothetical protein
MSTAKYSQRPERRELLPSYVRLKHKYSLANIISKSHLEDQDLPVGKLGGRKILNLCFRKYMTHYLRVGLTYIFCIFEF